MHELQGDSYASKQALPRPPQLMSEFAHTTSRRPVNIDGANVALPCSQVEKISTEVLPQNPDPLHLVGLGVNRISTQ